MLDLESLIKETARGPYWIEVQNCLEDSKLLQTPENYKLVAKRLTHRRGILVVDDRIIVPKRLRYAALKALHFGHPGINKMCNDAVIFWWPNMRADIEKKAKTCSVCLNTGKNLKSQKSNTEISKFDPPNNPGEGIQIDLTINPNKKHLNSSPFILIAVDKNRRWPAVNICNNTDHDTVISFLRDYIKIYGVPKTIKVDNDSAFISKEYKKLCNKYNIIRKYGTPNVDTGTGLVKRTIHSMKNLIKANLEEEQNLRESSNKALYVLRFTIHSELKKTPFELHFGQKPGTKLFNLKNTVSVDSKELSVYITRNSAGKITDHLLMSKKKTTDPKYRRGTTFTQKEKPTNRVSMEKNTNYPSTFFEKTQKKRSIGSIFENKPWTAISAPKHTVTTDKNKFLRTKFFSNPLPFQSVFTPTNRINTRMMVATERPSCSKAGEQAICSYRRKEPRKQNHGEQRRLSNTQRTTTNWKKTISQPRQMGRETNGPRSEHHLRRWFPMLQHRRRKTRPH